MSLSRSGLDESGRRRTKAAGEIAGNDSDVVPEKAQAARHIKRKNGILTVFGSSWLGKAWAG